MLKYYFNNEEKYVQTCFIKYFIFVFAYILFEIYNQNLFI